MNESPITPPTPASRRVSRRRRRAVLLVSFLLSLAYADLFTTSSGCSHQVDNVSTDLAMNMNLDLTMSGDGSRTSDVARPVDVTMTPDFTMPADVSTPPDVTKPPDVSPPVDVLPPFDAAGCNTVASAAPPVFSTQVPAPNPTFAGGSIVPGTYWLTAFTTYTGADGGSKTTTFTVQGTAVITTTTIQTVEGYGVAPLTLAHYTSTYTTSATLSLVPLCGGTDPFWFPGAIPYTATSTEIQVFGGSNVTEAGIQDIVYTWTLQ
jgi:hypothetical protein